MSLEFYLRVESRPLLTEAPVHSQIDEGERTPAHLVGLVLLNLIGTEYLHISPKPTLIILQIILDGVGLWLLVHLYDLGMVAWNRLLRQADVIGLEPSYPGIGGYDFLNGLYPCNQLLVVQDRRHVGVFRNSYILGVDELNVGVVLLQWVEWGWLINEEFFLLFGPLSNCYVFLILFIFVLFLLMGVGLGGQHLLLALIF